MSEQDGAMSLPDALGMVTELNDMREAVGGILRTYDLGSGIFSTGVLGGIRHAIDLARTEMQRKVSDLNRAVGNLVGTAVSLSTQEAFTTMGRHLPIKHELPSDPSKPLQKNGIVDGFEIFDRRQLRGEHDHATPEPRRYLAEERVEICLVLTPDTFGPNLPGSQVERTLLPTRKLLFQGYASQISD